MSMGGGGDTRSTRDLSALVETFRQGTEYHELAREIRTKTGFEDAFLPSSYSKLAAVSRGGPVVILSSDDVAKATHALIILRPDGEPIPLPLSDVSYEDIRRRVASLAQLLESCNVLRRQSVSESGRAGQPTSRRRSTSSRFNAILQWIWTKIVRPVLDILAREGVSSGRLWWCPAGDFTRLPLHAAMPLDCPFIPSYTYTLESLVNARAQKTIAKEKIDPGPLRILAKSKLSEVVEAANGCLDKPLFQVVKIEDAEARIDTTLNAMTSSDIIHLACHGWKDGEQSLNSHLILSDGNLQLREILSAELSKPKFGFLSACQTATGDIELANESFHLAGGFMAAGLKGVIATLWSIADEDAPRMAEEVYRAILTKDGMDPEKAAEGLHCAVRKMREDDLPPQRWIPFIHVGI
ncbi:hypothetical protein Agabi119p4_5213 [Agaricus bisporus var. burnettii]|uniref:CHAT domain-containing protein n=1 Tax=Agaricus bisporus var. burnettii TaxID=192524 RepID=A0A8H7KI23_AGABI|nr:hypothetical protein Agabi119p4_5213 [Agaricus bisporus var. burnettii]